MNKIKTGNFTSEEVNKKRIKSEIPFKLFIRIWSNAQSPYMYYLGIEERLGVRLYVLYKQFNQVLRFSAPGADKNPVSTMYIIENNFV